MKLIELCSLDLMWSLHIGGMPRFAVSDEDTWRSVFDKPMPQFGMMSSTFACEHLVEPRLHTVFIDVHQLADILNNALDSDTPVRGADFTSWLDHIQRRLLSLRYTDDRSSESFRLGLLAAMTLLHQFPGRRMVLTDLTHRFRRACIWMVGRRIHSTLKLWLLMIGAMTAFEADESWLLIAWHQLAPVELSWEEVRAKLEGVLWIRCVHDEPGRRAFMAFRNVAVKQEIKAHRGSTK
jgi:hypothetical protein